MAVCEMCGKEGNTVTATIEGVDLKVCSGCAKFGKVKQEYRGAPKLYQKPIIKEEPAETLVAAFAPLLRTARESRNMTQEEFAKFLQERESQVAKWEQGTLKPGIEDARKLERRLGLKLVEKDEIKKAEIQIKVKKDEFTLGDFVKVRKRGN